MLHKKYSKQKLKKIYIYSHLTDKKQKQNTYSGRQ